MTTITLERHFPAPPEKVFAFVSKTEHLLEWWGPEGMHTPEHDLAFDKIGAWWSVMVNGEGQRYKVSGQVTHVDAPNSVGFTWAWHDESDARGVESHVTIRLVPAQNGGTDMTLSHADLPDGGAAESHTMGWTSALRKLDAMLQD